MGGDITAESGTAESGTAEGSVFTLRLGLVAAEPVVESAHSDAGRTGAGGLRVLVAEDQANQSLADRAPASASRLLGHRGGGWLGRTGGARNQRVRPVDHGLPHAGTGWGGADAPDPRDGERERPVAPEGAGPDGGCHAADAGPLPRRRHGRGRRQTHQPRPAGGRCRQARRRSAQPGCRRPHDANPPSGSGAAAVFDASTYQRVFGDDASEGLDWLADCWPPPTPSSRKWTRRRATATAPN